MSSTAVCLYLNVNTIFVAPEGMVTLLNKWTADLEVVVVPTVVALSPIKAALDPVYPDWPVPFVLNSYLKKAAWINKTGIWFGWYNLKGSCLSW